MDDHIRGDDLRDALFDSVGEVVDLLEIGGAGDSHIFVDVRTLCLLTLLQLSVVSAIVIFSTLALYALAANRARGFLRSTRAMKLVHRAAAGLMAGVAVAVATR